MLPLDIQWAMEIACMLKKIPAHYNYFYKFNGKMQLAKNRKI